MRPSPHSDNVIQQRQRENETGITGEVKHSLIIV
jgi:hypothetical protein